MSCSNCYDNNSKVNSLANLDSVLPLWRLNEPTAFPLARWTTITLSH